MAHQPLAHQPLAQQPLAHQPARTFGPLRPKHAFMLAALVALAVGTGSYLAWHGVKPAQASRSAPAAVPVSVANAARKNVPIYLTGLGAVQATFTVGIHSQVDGKLQDVFFKEGQHVERNEVLAKIDPRLFKAALDQAKAKKAQDQATLIGLQKDLERFLTLGAKGFDTQQNIDQQQAKVDTTKATVAADDAAIETAQTQLDYTDIRAPTGGRMGVRLVDPGNIVHASDQGAIAMLVQTQPAAAMFTLPAQTLDAVREAMARGAVEAVAYDRDNPQRAQRRHAADRRQHDRPDDSDLSPEGDIPQRRREAVAGRVRQHPHPGQHPNRCDRGAEHGDPARPEGPVRLGGHEGEQGHAEAGADRPVGRRHHHRQLRRR